mgnify:CR=1 FL=1
MPETADVPLIDEESGTEFERELSLVDVEEISREWSDTFSFSVTISGMEQTHFIWEIWRSPGMRILLTTEKTSGSRRTVPGVLPGRPRGVGRRTL